MAEPIRDVDLPPELANLPPEVVVTNPEYFLVPPEERLRRRQEWLDRLRQLEPIELPVSGAELVAEGRREEEYWPSGT
jgi:hypothetical protein